MFEFLFCPQHGIFRPDNIALFLAYAGAIRVEIETLYIRVAALFGRYL